MCYFFQAFNRCSKELESLIPGTGSQQNCYFIKAVTGPVKFSIKKITSYQRTFVMPLTGEGASSSARRSSSAWICCLMAGFSASMKAVSAGPMYRCSVPRKLTAAPRIAGLFAARAFFTWISTTFVFSLYRVKAVIDNPARVHLSN